MSLRSQSTKRSMNLPAMMGRRTRESKNVAEKIHNNNKKNKKDTWYYRFLAYDYIHMTIKWSTSLAPLCGCMSDRKRDERERERVSKWLWRIGEQRCGSEVRHEITRSFGGTRENTKIFICRWEWENFENTMHAKCLSGGKPCAQSITSASMTWYCRIVGQPACMLFWWIR